MPNKYLTGDNWGKFASGRNIKDGTLIDAMATLARESAADPLAWLKAVDVVDKLIDKLTVTHKGDNDIASHLKKMAKACKEERELATQAKEQAEEDANPEALSAKRLLPLLRAVRQGEPRPALIAVAGRDTAVLLSRRAISAAGRKPLAEALKGSGSVRYISAQCLFENNAHTFVVDGAPAGLAKRVKAALLVQVQLKFKVRVRGADAADVDEDLDGDDAAADGAEGANGQASNPQPTPTVVDIKPLLLRTQQVSNQFKTLGAERRDDWATLQALLVHVTRQLQARKLEGLDEALSKLEQVARHMDQAAQARQGTSNEPSTTSPSGASPKASAELMERLRAQLEEQRLRLAAMKDEDCADIAQALMMQLQLEFDEADRATVGDVSALKSLTEGTLGLKEEVGRAEQQLKAWRAFIAAQEQVQPLLQKVEQTPAKQCFLVDDLADKVDLFLQASAAAKAGHIDEAQGHLEALATLLQRLLASRDAHQKFIGELQAAQDTLDQAERATAGTEGVAQADCGRTYASQLLALDSARETKQWSDASDRLKELSTTCVAVQQWLLDLTKHRQDNAADDTAIRDVRRLMAQNPTVFAQEDVDAFNDAVAPYDKAVAEGRWRDAGSAAKATKYTRTTLLDNWTNYQAYQQDQPTIQLERNRMSALLTNTPLPLATEAGEFNDHADRLDRAVALGDWTWAADEGVKLLQAVQVLDATLRDGDAFYRVFGPVRATVGRAMQALDLKENRLAPLQGDFRKIHLKVRKAVEAKQWAEAAALVDAYGDAAEALDDAATDFDRDERAFRVEFGKLTQLDQARQISVQAPKTLRIQALTDFRAVHTRFNDARVAGRFAQAQAELVELQRAINDLIAAKQLDDAQHQNMVLALTAVGSRDEMAQVAAHAPKSLRALAADFQAAEQLVAQLQGTGEWQAVIDRGIPALEAAIDALHQALDGANRAASPADLAALRRRLAKLSTRLNAVAQASTAPPVEALRVQARACRQDLTAALQGNHLNP